MTLNTNALSFLQDVMGFNQAQHPKSSADKGIKLAVIDSAYVSSSFATGTLPRVTFEGESTLSTKFYPVLGSYWPQPSDRVALVPIGTTWLIIGAVSNVDGGVWTPGNAHVGGNLDVTGTTSLTGTTSVTGTLNVGNVVSTGSITLGSSGVINLGSLAIANGRVPGQLIASSAATSDSSNFTTTEVVVMTVNASLVSGRVYSIWAGPTFHSSVDGDVVHTQLREDSVSGTVRDRTDDYIRVSPAAIDKTVLFSLYTAVSTGTKTFVVTGDRVAGTGNCRLEADTIRPAYMLVRYESG